MVDEAINFWGDVYGFAMNCMKTQVYSKAAVTTVPQDSIVTNCCLVKVCAQSLNYTFVNFVRQEFHFLRCTVSGIFMYLFFIMYDINVIVHRVRQIDLCEVLGGVTILSLCSG